MHLPLTVFFLCLKDQMLPCLSKTVLGIICPGCGFQRSILLLLNGDFLGAFKMYPAIYTLIPFALLLIVSTIFKLKNTNPIISLLGITSVGLILINYFFKLIF